MPAAGVLLIIAVLVIVAALVYYLVATILTLQKIAAGLDDAIEGVGGIIAKSAPVAEVVETINQTLDAGVDLLEGLLVTKAGMRDAVGLVDGLYPGAAAAGFRNFPESQSTRAPRISEVYTRGTLTLARLGREAPIAAASPAGPALRDATYGSSAARTLYPGGRPSRTPALPRSPIIGTGSPVQYEPSDEVGAPRRRLPAPATAGAGNPAEVTPTTPPRAQPTPQPDGRQDADPGTV
jgi:hypothetical protein